MRFALGAAAPARFITFFITRPFTPLNSSGRSGALVSATSTSPFGSTYTQRGWARPVAKARTSRPGAASGLAPSGQPFAGAILTVGIRVSFGSASCGLEPTVDSNGSFAVSAQPRRKASVKRDMRRRAGIAALS